MILITGILGQLGYDLAKELHFGEKTGHGDSLRGIYGGRQGGERTRTRFDGEWIRNALGSGGLPRRWSQNDLY